MVSTRNRQTILIIDDNPTNLKVAVDYLKAYSYHVLIARNGETGIERAQMGEPDLILLDVQMPVLDGYETCRRLSANPDTCNIPVIFMTALSGVEDKVRAFEAGGVDYVTKPVEERELLARVRAQLKIRSLQRELEQYAEHLEEKVSERTADFRTAQAQSETQAKQNEAMRDLIRAQGRQIRVLTQQWVDAESGGKASRSRLGVLRVELLRAHLEQIRDLLRTLPPSADLNESIQSHVLVALELFIQIETQNISSEVVQQALAPSGPSPFEALSERERGIVDLLVQGLANKEIAYELDLARTTISTHRKRIMGKLGVQDLSSLIKLALRHGIAS